jgi:hypothetical protein
MEFRIADTFTDSLARLPSQEQKAVKTTAFDMQINPGHPGLQFHRIERAKDLSFWSVRVNRDVRLIVHKTDEGLLLCYVDHHDKAYAWAERRRIERHPRTGAAQLVEIRERIEELPVYAPAPAVEAKPPLFAHQPDDVLLSYGVPTDWLSAVRQVDEDGLFELAEHLPQEAAEALLDLAVGATPKVAEVLPTHGDAFAHPDSVASGSWRMWTSCARLWNIPGSAGRSSCIRRSGSWWRGGTADRRAWRARLGPARRWSHCTGRRSWRGAIRARGCW